METQQGESGRLRRRGPASAAHPRNELATRSERPEIRLIPGFDVSAARTRGFPVTDLALRKAQSRYLGAYAWELDVDPRDRCPLCGEIFGGWCLHADHVMPEHYNALYQDGDQWRPAREADEVPLGTDVYHAVQCAAYAHAPCNLRKGRSADIANWRLADFEPLIVAESDLGKAIAVPGPTIVPAEPRTPQQRAAEALGIRHSKAGSGSTRGRRLSIEERNREATLAQENLGIYDRLAAVRRGHRDTTGGDAAALMVAASSRAQTRGEGRPGACNYRGTDRLPLCVGNGAHRGCWCGNVSAETADALVAEYGPSEALRLLVRGPQVVSRALSASTGQGAAPAIGFRRSKFCESSCTGHDGACAACSGYTRWRQQRGDS